MKTIKNKGILVSVFVIVCLLVVYYFAIQKISKHEYDNLLKQSGTSYLDTFVRRNFGFGIDLSDEENKKFNISCVEADSPRSIELKNNSSYITCHNDGAAYRVFIGWKNYSYDRLSYAKDVADTILKTRGSIDSGKFSCIEDRTFAWKEKIPATISDCYIKIGTTTLYYSILFLYPAKIREISPTIIVANVSAEDPKVRDKLRVFIERVRYVPNNTFSVFKSFPDLGFETAYAGGGGGGGGGAGAGSCGAGSAGCGGSAGGDGGGDVGFTSPTPIEYAACGPNNNNSFDTAPTGDCSVGTPSGVSGGGPWTWTCSNVNGSASCTAYPKAICGLATSRKYKESESSLVNKNDPCETGVSSDPVIARDGNGKATSISWTCTSAYPNGVKSCSTAIVDPALAVNITPSGVPRTCAAGETWNGTTCVAPSGTLTASASSCDIVAGQSSCNINLTWNTLNNTYTSKVVSDSTSSPLYTSNSDTNRLVTIAKTGQTFYLYNNNKILSSIDVKAVCTNGTTWDGNTCVYPAGVITPSASSCYVAANASSCNINFDWYTDYPVGISAITSDGVTLYTANEGTDRPITLGFTNSYVKTYYLYNNARLLHQISLRSSCTPGASWNGSVCILPTGTISAISSPNCVIPVNARTCSLPISWNTTNPINTSSVVISSTNSQVANSNSGSYNALVSKNGETYYLRNNGINIDSVFLTASCQAGSSWSGTICKKN